MSPAAHLFDAGIGALVAVSVRAAWALYVAPRLRVSRCSWCSVRMPRGVEGVCTKCLNYVGESGHAGPADWPEA